MTCDQVEIRRADGVVMFIIMKQCPMTTEMEKENITRFSVINHVTKGTLDVCASGLFVCLNNAIRGISEHDYVVWVETEPVMNNCVVHRNDIIDATLQLIVCPWVVATYEDCALVPCHSLLVLIVVLTCTK